MPRPLGLRAAFGTALLWSLAGAVHADGDVEPNDTFATRASQSPAVRIVQGSLQGAPDTVLGAFDEFDQLIESDDDHGDNGGDLLVGIPVNDDRSVLLRVSGYDDFDFDGLSDDELAPHERFGPFRLHVEYFDDANQLISSQDASRQLAAGGVQSFSFTPPAAAVTFSAQTINTPLADPRDYYKFTGFSPGSPLVAEIVAGSVDTVIASFDANGVRTGIDDDGGAPGGGGFSRLELASLGDGSATIAVTGYHEGYAADFEGGHQEIGSYTLTVSAASTPVPALPRAAWLLLAGLLLAVAWLGRAARGPSA